MIAHRKTTEDLFVPAEHAEAEKGVLASIMLKPAVLDDVQLEIRPADFCQEPNRLLYEHLLSLYNNGRPIDVTTVVSSLRKARGGDLDALEAIGGVPYIGSLMELLPSPANAVYYARLVQEASTLRQLQFAASDVLDQVRNGPESARDVLAEHEKRVLAISESNSRGDRVAEMRDVVHEALSALDERKDGATGGIPTGYDGLDDMTGGLRAGETIVLAGRTSMGKSALAVNIAENIAKAGKRILYVSLEMSRLELADRLLSAAARVDSHRMRSGTLNPEERRKIVAAGAVIGSTNLIIDDTSTRNVREIAAIARRLQRRKGLDLLIIDYIQFIEPDDKRAPRQEQVAGVSRRLKGLARELSIPVICLAQLNRQAATGADNKPQLSHLRESGAIEQDADMVLFVHRPQYYSANKPPYGQGEEAELIVAKQRNGPTGTSKVLWFGNFVRFDNPEQSHFDPSEARWTEERNFGDTWA